MKELGYFLKTERVENGISLTEASEDLNLSTTLLENIESGNIRAFKDVYELRDEVKKYAKYLGLDVDKVMDQFNDFLFEKTSKISLDEIKEATKKSTSEEKKISSPYTVEKKKKIVIWPFLLGIVIVILIFAIIYLIFSNIDGDPVRTDELMGIEERMM